MLLLVRKQQFNRLFAMLDPPCGIDARAYGEHQIGDPQALLHIGHAQHRLETGTRRIVQLLHPEVREDPVLARDRHDIARRAYSHQVQQWLKVLERDRVVLREALHQLETDTAPTEVFARVSTIGTQWIQHRHRCRQHGARPVVIANDEVDTALVGVVHLVVGFDAAIECDDQTHLLRCCMIDPHEGDPVTLGVPIGDVVGDVAREAREEGVHERHGGGAIHIVVAVNHDALVLAERTFNAFHSHAHVGHEEGVM